VKPTGIIGPLSIHNFIRQQAGWVKPTSIIRPQSIHNFIRQLQFDGVGGAHQPEPWLFSIGFTLATNGNGHRNDGFG
jgi:hypothetical protein